MLNEFRVIDIFSSSSFTNDTTSFTVGVRFKRLSEYHLATTFFQTFLLWLISYLTLFINIQDFGNRFMGSLTALLVLSALLSASTSSLPKTAYFKHIDVWQNWFILNIFFIIMIHAIIDYLERNKCVYNRPVKKANSQHYHIRFSHCTNFVAIFLLPLATITFTYVYFLLSHE